MMVRQQTCKVDFTKLVRFALTPLAAISVALSLTLGARAATTADYVQDGLVAMWDGYENAGRGKHKTDQTEWVDVVGGRVLTLAAGESFNNIEVTLAPGAHYTEEALFDAPGDVTIEVNGRPVSPTSQYLMLVVGIPNFAELSWDARKGGISIKRVDTVGATANHYITYDSGYSSASEIAKSGVSQTYTTLIGVDSSAVYVNGQSRVQTNGMDWKGNPRSSDFRVAVGDASSSAVIRNIRIYNRKLTAEEVAANYAVDVKRFVDGELGMPKDKLDISTSLGVDVGTTPACGRRSGLEPGDSIPCSAPASYRDPNGTVDYTCTGYRLYDSVIDQESGDFVLKEVDGSPFSGTSFTYTHGDTARHLVWQFKAPLGVEKPTFVLSESGSGEVTALVTGIGMTATSATLTFAYGTTEACSDGTVEVPVTTDMGEFRATIPGTRRGQIYYVKATLANTTDDTPVTSDVVSTFLTKVPEGYTPVEYVESTGKQYINSVYTVTTNTVLVMDFVPWKLNDDYLFFGTGWTGSPFLLRSFKTEKPNSFWYAGTVPLCSATPGTRYVVTAGQGKVTVAEKPSQKQVASVTVAKNTGTLKLFGRDNFNLSLMRLYSLKIYEGAELARDFVLCKNDKSVAGLYDPITDTFVSVTAKNVPALVAGPDVIQTNVLEVATTLGFDPGTAPACGRVTNLVEGATVPCSAPAAVSDRTCTGYKLYDCTINPMTAEMELTEVPDAASSDTSFTYTHGATMRRLVWQYTGTASSTNAYVGEQNGCWDVAANWSKGVVPSEADDVVIEGKSVYLAPSSASVTVKSLTLKGCAALEVQAPPAANPKNVSTVYPGAFKLNVTETFAIKSRATFRPVVDGLTGNPVFVNCTDFILEDGGRIDVSQAGYTWASTAGVDLAALKAEGHVYLTTQDGYSYCPSPVLPGNSCYGSGSGKYGYPYAPWLAGAMGQLRGKVGTTLVRESFARGGGAVVVFASGKQTVAGDIWAEGGFRTYGGSSGGGIWLVGGSFDVHSTARLNANGGTYDFNGNPNGTGGRISLGAGLTADQISNLVTGQVPARVSLACGDNLDFMDAHAYAGHGKTPVVIDTKRSENGTRTYTVNTNALTLVAVKGVGVLGASRIGGLVSVASSGQVTLGVERLKGSADSLSHFSASSWRLLDGKTEIANGEGSTATWTPEKKYALLTLEWTIDAITKDPEPEFFTDLPTGSGAEKAFTGADGGRWEEPANWTPAGVPGLSDAVTLTGKTVYAAGLVGAKTLAVAADATLVVGGTGEDVLAETAADGPKFGLKVAEGCSIAGRVAIGGKDLTVPVRMAVGGDLTLEGEAVLAVYAMRASKHVIATLYAEATQVTVGGKLTLGDMSQIVPDSDYLTGASVHFSAGSVEIAEGASFNAVGRGWGWTPRNGDDYAPEIRGYGASYNGAAHETYAHGSGRYGAGYGGLGDRSTAYDGRVYGYQYAPFLPGSCGSSVSPRGAGAIWIDCGGQFTLNGALDASGESAATTSGKANTSGGGIWVSAMGFSAGAQAKLLANGGSTVGTGYGGAGGRIALLLRTTEADREALAYGETPEELTYSPEIAGVGTLSVAGGAGSLAGTTPNMAGDGTVATVRGTVAVPTVHVTGDPVEAVSADVAYGDVVTSIGATVSFSASEYGIDPNASYIRYVCTGYLATNATGTVVAQGEGRSVTFTVEDNDTYFTWLWGGRQTAMEVVVPSGCGGSVSYDGTAHSENFKIWASDGGVIEAVPSSGYEFLYWLGDVPAGSERAARLTLPSGIYRSVMPVFRPAAAATTRTWLGGTGGWTDPAMWDGGVIPGLADTAVVGSGVAIVSNYAACANVTVNGSGKLLVGCVLVSGKTTVVAAYPTMNVMGCGTVFAFDRVALDVSGALTVGGTAEVAVGADNFAPYPQVIARDVSLVDSGVLYFTAAPRTETLTYDTGTGFLTVGNDLTVADTAQLCLRSDSYSGGSMVCTVANRFTLAAGAKVNANDGGFWGNMAKSPQSLQPPQTTSSSDGRSGSHGGIGNGSGTSTTYDFLYAPRMPGSTVIPVPNSNMNSAEPGGGVIRIHARQANIAGALQATTSKSGQYTGSAGGSIWVTTEGKMTFEPGATMTVKGGTTYYGNPAKGGGGGRIALARYLTPAELAALTADGDTLPEGRFVRRPAKRVFDDVAFTNLFPGVTVNFSGAPGQGATGCGTFRFLDGKTGGTLLLVR